MSGALVFGKDIMITLNSASTGFIAEFLRPYLNINQEISEKIYFHYDLYDGFIDFTELTSEQYLEAYGIMKKAFENDLKNEPVIGGRSRQWAVDLWFNEIKPKMQISPLYIK
ncbi:hypothetical protein SOASR030_22470 [Leminorella grimontii]|uniref:CdiI immunity protein domain-containing protein n=1 Tax=Leminorella grimontii TaxID=82981 RepID=A0AAV5N3J0_9GAMM|nr:hypothetical protein [Leminorella grimontii]KFC96628.1 hypothetical protein GLGR_0990 [Leminorella grimontii ATCC 33999 = DSM 5078]GKX56135.1 hypothetical protein SOASR030_22470 [Leminorella grimontii]VFS57950.1 Uncharacterised protein [Leminorella grimontii]